MAPASRALLTAGALVAAALAVAILRPVGGGDRLDGGVFDPADDGQGPPLEELRQRRAASRAEMFATLNLSAEQRTRVEDLLSLRDERREAIFSRVRGADDAEVFRRAREELRALSADVDRQIESILTDDQRDRYRSWRQRSRGERWRRSAEGGGLRI